MVHILCMQALDWALTARARGYPSKHGALMGPGSFEGLKLSGPKQPKSVRVILVII